MENTARVIEISATPNETELKQEIAVYTAPLVSFKVVDSISMSKANDTIKEINTRLKNIDVKFEKTVEATAETKRKAEAARKTLDTLIEEIKQPLVNVKTYLSGEGKRYLTEQEVIRKAEETRQREIARKAEEDRRIAEAEQAEREGNTAEAQAIIEEEIYVPAPVVEKTTPKVDNRLFAKRWTGEGKDIMLAIRYIAQNPQYKNLLTFDSSAINNMARSMKGPSPVPGIDFTER